MDTYKDGRETLLDESQAAGPETAAPAYELKVLGGRHAGAVMPLAPASHQLGQDEECDLIFLDDAFLNGRLIVDVSGPSPMLSTTGEVRAVLDGKAIEGTVALEPYQVVEVGATRFALGIVGEPWPEPPKPDLPVPAESAGGEEGADESAPQEEPEKEEAPPPVLPRTVRMVRLLRRHRIPVAIAAAVLVVGAGITYVATRPGPDYLGAARRMVVSLSLPEVQVREEGGRLISEGFVATEMEKKALRDSLSRLGLHTEDRIISREETVLSIRQVLEISSVNYVVEMGKGGAVTLFGVDDDSLRIEDITMAARQAVRSGVVVETRIQSSVAVKTFLARFLAAKSLVHKVKVDVDQGRVHGLLVTGRMDDSELAAWAQVKASFRSHFGFDVGERWTEKLSPTLQQFAAATKELDSDLLGVSPGEMAYISLRGGRKCFEGGKLRSGPYVQSIKMDRLVLVIGTVEEVYYIKKGRR